MRPVVGRDWIGLILAGVELQSQATPPAKLAFLQTADRWPLDAAVMPYAGCAMLFRGGETGLVTRNFRICVAPGANHARYHCAVGYNSTTGAQADIVATTTYGGVAGNDPTRIVAQSIQGGTRTFNAHQISNRLAILSGDWVDDAPTINCDRQLELEQLAHPKVEPCSIAYVCGVSVGVSRQIEDLEGL